MRNLNTVAAITRYARILVTISCLSSFFAVAAWGHTIKGRIVGVHDGDSVTLLDSTNRQYKVRLGGIDAPEIGQAFGRASKDNLSRLALSREAIAECGKVDRYRREVYSLTVGGTDAGLAQIEAGMAWYFRRYERELTADRRRLNAEAEDQARSRKKGLWSDKSPVAPWDWRAAKRR